MARSYLIVEPICIIAEDLALILRDHDAQAAVMVAGSAESALRVVTPAAQVRLALVHADPAGFAQSGLGHALQERGAQVVFIGDRAERAARNGVLPAEHVLESPFSTQTVLALLHRIDA